MANDLGEVDCRQNGVAEGSNAKDEGGQGSALEADRPAPVSTVTNPTYPLDDQALEAYFYRYEKPLSDGGYMRMGKLLQKKHDFVKPVPISFPRIYRD